MRVKAMLFVAAVMALCLAVGAGPAVSDCQIDGSYDSDRGSVLLVQKDEMVTGTWPKGTVIGERAGDIIRFTWYDGPEPGGRGVWRVSADCGHLTGTWGSGSSDTDGGSWDMRRQELKIILKRNPRR